MTPTMTPKIGRVTEPSDLACPPRFATRRNPLRPTMGHEVAAIARRLGRPLMPWQRYVADVATEYEPIRADTTEGQRMLARSTLGFRMVYREVDLLVPRQSGKSSLILAMAVHRAMRFGPARRQGITYTAQTRNDAAQKWREDYLETLQPQIDVTKPAPFAKYLRKPRLTNGSEAIRFRNGSEFGVMSVTKKSGHGPTRALGFIDEAFAQVDDRLEQALRPSMVTLPDAQYWIVSTAGDSSSAFLYRKVLAGRERDPLDDLGSTAYFEWSAPDDADPADPAVWHATMPALGYTTFDPIIAGEQRDMPADEFARAYLCQWLGKKAIDPIVDLGVWGELVSRHAPLSPIALSLDVSPLRNQASIVAAGPATDGRPALEVIENGPAEHLVDRLVEIAGRQDPCAIVIDGRSPAAAMIEPARARGLEVQIATSTDLARASMAWADLVNDRGLWWRGEPAMQAAVEGARKRDAGEGMWTLSRAQSTTDITPLVAGVLALLGVTRWGGVEPDYDLLSSAY